MSEVKEANSPALNQFRTVIIPGDDYYECAVIVMRVPREVADSLEGKMVVNAILGKDPEYNPFSRTTKNENDEHIAAVNKILLDWKAKYSMKPRSADTNMDVVFGSTYV